MGESVAEASLIKWRKEEGDTVEIDDVIVEIATDKVDTDVPSEFSGVLIEKRFSENDVIQVGEVIAVIKTSGGDSDIENETKEKKNKPQKTKEKLIKLNRGNGWHATFFQSRKGILKLQYLMIKSFSHARRIFFLPAFICRSKIS